MKPVIAALFSMALAGCAQSEPEPSIYDGAVVVKICMDGTRIFRLRDGRFITGGLGPSWVAGPDVCQTPK